jgi:small subunit ribosomal protein S16
MLKIRLQRVGRKNIPVFRVLVTDSQNSTKSGKFLEILGTYDPVSNKKEVNADRVKYWISKGAQTTGTVHNFLVSKKIIEGKKINVLPSKRAVLSRKEEKKAGEAKKEAPKVVTPAA